MEGKMKNLAEAKAIAARQRLTNVHFLSLSADDSESVVIAVVGERDGVKNLVYSTSAKTTSPIDDIASLFE
jgi:hypothetical protein